MHMLIDQARLTVSLPQILLHAFCCSTVLPRLVVSVTLDGYVHILIDVQYRAGEFSQRCSGIAA